MIEINNLSKFFNNQKALYMVDLKLPRYGMVAIQGPSGCGKTTLLNCLAGLIPFEGDIRIDGYEYKNKSESQNSLFRLSNIGFVFQDFRLFDNETVLENIMFPLDTLNNIDKEKKLIKCEELLKLVGLKGKEHKFVSCLSGGEKQRVCIARSMINDPKIILADEPTGALDSSNSTQIMDILEEISSKSLVIFVTHDDELAKEYGDQIIQMKDGVISNIIYSKHKPHSAYIPIIKTRNHNQKPSIPFSFIFKHSYHALLRKKVRSIICSITTSIGLIGVGLALSISSFISKNVKEAYSSLIKKDQIVVSSVNGDKSKYGEYPVSYKEVRNLADKYDEYVVDIGVDYIADFENIFLDLNELDIADSSIRRQVKGFSARSINDFEWLDISNNEFYPEKPERLENDEIYLGLDISSIQDLCFSLRIERTVNSLSDYLAANDCYVVFNFAHYEWGYEDQQILNIRGFSLENELKIYHTNHLWNQYMLEDCMRLPSEDTIEGEVFYPWTLRKCTYLYCNDSIDNFLTYANKNGVFDNYVLEIATNKHFSLLYKNIDVKDKRRVIVFKNLIDGIDCSTIDYLMDYEENIFEPLVGTNYGFVIYPNSLMMGFSENAFLSFDKDKINDAIDVETNIKLMNDQHIEYPDGLLQGHFTKSMTNGLSFNVLPEKIDIGKAPETLDEIVISKGISNLIKGSAIDKTIYFSFPSSAIQKNTGEVLKTYKTIPLTITGIVDNEDLYLYHNYMWPVSFFQSRIGVSMFNLKCQSISFSLKNPKLINETIESLKTGFKTYDIINPLKDINESVDELSNYVSVISLMFSLFASITSILLLSICSYLHVYETRGEIGLARCIGASQIQANKFIFGHALTLSGIALVLSCVELVVLSLVISYEMSGQISLSLSPLPFLAMLGLALFISLFASTIITISLRKHNPIEITKY